MQHNSLDAKEFNTVVAKPRQPDLKNGVSRPRLRRFTIKPDFSECEYNKVTYVFEEKVSEGTYGATLLFHEKGKPKNKALIKVEKPKNGKYIHAATMAQESIFCILMLGDGAVSGSLTSQNEPHCVFEPFVEGVTLNKFPIQSGQQLLDIFMQILERADYMHRHLYLTHGDIKNNNIIVRVSDGRVVFIDFTFMRFIDDPTVGLTADYLAPELKDEIPANPNQDVLSIGVMLKVFFEYYKTLLQPFAAQSIPKLLEDMTQKEPEKRKTLQEQYQAFKKLHGMTRAFDYIIENQDNMAEEKAELKVGGMTRKFAAAVQSVKPKFDNHFISDFIAEADQEQFLHLLRNVQRKNRFQFLKRIDVNFLNRITGHSFAVKKAILQRLNPEDILAWMDSPAARGYIRSHLKFVDLLDLLSNLFTENQRLQFLIKFKVFFLKDIANNLSKWNSILSLLTPDHRMQMLGLAVDEIKIHLKNTQQLADFLKINFDADKRMEALNILGGLNFLQGLINNVESIAAQLNPLFSALPISQIGNLLKQVGAPVCRTLFGNSEQFKELICNLGPEKEKAIIGFHLDTELKKSSFDLMLKNGVDCHKASDELYEKLLFSSYDVYERERDKYKEHKKDIFGKGLGYSKTKKFLAIKQIRESRLDVDELKQLQKNKPLNEGDLGKVSSRLFPVLFKTLALEKSLTPLEELKPSVRGVASGVRG
jgi:serine/threonine protein kinase